IDHGDRAETGQLAGTAGALQGAGEDLGEGEAPQAFAEAAGVALAALGQRQVGPSGVLAGDAPGRFAVAGEVGRGQGLAHEKLLAGCLGLFYGVRGSMCFFMLWFLRARKCDDSHPSLVQKSYPAARKKRLADTWPSAAGRLQSILSAGFGRLQGRGVRTAERNR